MKSYLALSNKYFFITLLIILIGILTGINNYYFYAHVERSAARNLSQLEIQINAYRNYCIEKTITSEQCSAAILILTKAFSEKAYYNNTMIVKDKNQNILWKKPIKDWDKVVKSDIEIILPHNLIKEKIEINKSLTFNNSMMLISILKSMSFSIAELIENVNYKHIAQESGTFTLVDKNYKGNNIAYIINDTEYTLNKHHDFKFKTGDIVKKGNVIASGNIFVALDKFLSIYWFRSRPTIGFLIFSFLILYVYRQRELAIEKEQISVDQEVIETVVKSPHANSSEIYNRLKKYDHIINPPVNTLNADTLFDGDIDEVGTKFRKVAEKIVFKVYEKSIGKRTFRLDLNEAIYQLNKNGIISDNAKNYLSIVRVYGNLSSHYSEKTISKVEAITVASALLNVIEEIVEKNLLKEGENIKNNHEAITSTTQSKTKGLKIVKKASASPTLK